MKGRGALPAPPPSFTQRKERILAQLAVPEGEYTDASPKGSVDEGIRVLIDGINALEGFVTTSSCAGRVSVFREGEGRKLAGVGGKGGGGNWLFVSHDPVPLEDGEPERDLEDLLGLKEAENQEASSERVDDSLRDGAAARLIHFKFEPMVCLLC